MPFWITKLESRHNRTVVCARLREVVRPLENVWQDLESGVGPEPEAFAFEGSIEEPHFKVKRIIRYQNSSLPVIRGSISGRQAGTIIRLTMSIHPAAALFMAFWLGAVLQPFLVGEMRLSDDGAPDLGMMAAFGALIVIVPFCYEAWKAKKMLGEIVGSA